MHAYHPRGALPVILTGLAGCTVSPEISHGARKLT